MFGRANVGAVNRLSSTTFMSVGPYQHQPIGARVHLGVLGDVPIWYPRSHDAKREKSLGNLDDGKHVRVRILLAPFDCATEYLVWGVLSRPLVR